ncbi:hypothetical protein E2C01_033270 [Portunus trituberculatus]|uniref:Uncharacterized protein n=1 Tax=Portunus trituberculatus TaxID=210409 RepID=A0A5B7F3R3_PORTR|nr:hypothetical protein [Portunus trituberculatus]
MTLARLLSRGKRTVNGGECGGEASAEGETLSPPKCPIFLDFPISFVWLKLLMETVDLVRRVFEKN